MPKEAWCSVPDNLSAESSMIGDHLSKNDSDYQMIESREQFIFAVSDLEFQHYERFT